MIYGEVEYWGYTFRAFGEGYEEVREILEFLLRRFMKANHDSSSDKMTLPEEEVNFIEFETGQGFLDYQRWDGR